MSDLIPQRTDEVVLYRDEDQREIDRLSRAIKAAAAKSPTPLRLGDDDAVVAAAQAYDEFKDAAAERGIKVALKNMSGRKWRALAAEHPPRPDQPVDDAYGFNWLTMADAVVAPCVASIGGKELSGDALDEALDAMTDGDFSRVYDRVIFLNTGQAPDPKDSISQTLRRSSGETSESPERLG